MRIWCLFSIANDFYQPKNNLVAWWVNEPDLERLTLALSVVGDVVTDNDMKELLKEKRVCINGINYRLEQIIEGNV